MEQLENLNTLPFAQQIELIDEILVASSAAPQVVALTSRLRDHEPMAHAVRRLVRCEHLDDPVVVKSLRALFTDLPDTGIQRLLRGLERIELSDSEHEVFVECTVATMRALGIERIAATCLLDRWLKNAAPQRRSDLTREAVKSCRRAIETHTVDSVQDKVLVRIPGDRFVELDELANACGEHEIWRSRLDRFASALLAVLEGMPKSLSQANAENLLSHQVYTEPGHFFVELLQNAEDASATTWRVRISDREVVVWHDGIPFDPRDVVGVLSIGQTTKHKAQIGFFGVGFKSVYEICERPQIYSYPFSFEIADVSIPRRLSKRLEGHPEHGTLIVLPLRDAHEPRRTPDHLYRYALAVPPETLLTLPNIRKLDVGFGSLRRVVTESTMTAGRISLRQEENNEVRAQTYLVETAGFVYQCGEDRGNGDPTRGSDGTPTTDEEQRGLHRAEETPILVAVALDEHGCPKPLSPSNPTVFSYLPTGEKSGLRFLLHAHFDLPVDRERLDLSSGWNRWAIACAGDLLARVAKRLVDELESENSTHSADRLDALLSVLPIASDLRDLNYQGLVDRMVSELQVQALLPAADGCRVTPPKAAIADDPALGELLSGVVVDENDRRLLAPLNDRARELAVSLGVVSFGIRELIDLLERELPSLPSEGEDQVSATVIQGQEAVPEWINKYLPQLLDVLGRHSLEKEIERLRNLPILPDQNGHLRCPKDLVRGPKALRNIYHDSRVLLDATLDLQPTRDQAHLLDQLCIEVLELEQLLDDLRKPGPVRRAVATKEGANQLLGFLKGHPNLEQVRTAGLGWLPIFPDEQGHSRPLCVKGDEEDNRLWLAPSGPIGEFLRTMCGRRPLMIDADLQRGHAVTLSELGASEIDLRGFLYGIRKGRVELKGSDLLDLHRVLDSLRSDFSDRVREELIDTPLFLDIRGVAHPLRGEDAVWLPEDTAIVELCPAAPWINKQLINEFPYLRSLPIAHVGASSLIEVICDDSKDSRLLSLDTPHWLRSAYAYLAEHSESLPPRVVTRLGSAKFWLDTDGHRTDLSRMRKSAREPNLAALYRMWGAFSFIEELDEEDEGQARQTSAYQLFVVLRLDRDLKQPGYETLIDDLVEGAPIDATSTSLRPLLLVALEEAGTQLSKHKLRRLEDALIFRSSRGGLCPLGEWGRPDSAKCYRASAPLREPLSFGTSPLLIQEDEAELGDLLDRAGIEKATLSDLLKAVAADPLLAKVEVSRAVRRVLVEQVGELRTIAKVDKEWLSTLPMWPTTDGEITSAKSVHRGSILEKVLGSDWNDLIGPGQSVLAAEADDDAAALVDLFEFADPVALVIERLKRQGKPNYPLVEQPEFLSNLERLIHFLRIVAPHHSEEELNTLPLVLDAEGRLVCGHRYRTSVDEHRLCREFSIFSKLADPDWSAEAVTIAPSLAPELPALRVILALREICRDAMAADTHPVFSDSVQRARLYQWLLQKRCEIEKVPQSRGTLAATPCVITTAGMLRAPNELLFEPDLPEIGVDWNQSAELPKALADWFRSTFGLEEKRLKQVIRALTDAHKNAVASGDGDRCWLLTRYIARALGGRSEIEEKVASLPKSIKLRNELRVESERNTFARPRKLFLPDAENWNLLEECCEEVPLRVAKRYVDDVDVVRLLELLGAKRELSLEALIGLLSGQNRREGLKANLAFSSYLSGRIQQNPKLRHQLKLDHEKWIPDGGGEMCSPSDLYWPSNEAYQIIGGEAALFPHPEFFHSVEAEIGSTLPFRQIDDADLSLVVKRISQLGEAPPEILAWLNRGLVEHRLKASELRSLLAELPFLIDDRGDLRAPVEVMRKPPFELFGHRRGTWTNGNEYPRLRDALGIPHTTGVRDVLRFLEEVAVDIIEVEEKGGQGSDLLDEEPELAECLPRNLKILAAHNTRPPAMLPLVVTNATEDTFLISLATTPKTELALPTPKDIAAALSVKQLKSSEAQGPWLTVLGQDEDEIEPYLKKVVGLKTLGQLWQPHPLPKRLSSDLSHEYPEQVAQLETSITALMPLVPRLQKTFHHIPQESWRSDLDKMVRQWEVCIADPIAVVGDLGQWGSLTVERQIASEVGRIFLTPAMVAELDDIAAHLCHEVITKGIFDAKLAQAMEELLRLDNCHAMDAWLDKEGYRRIAEPKPISEPRPQHNKREKKARVKLKEMDDIAGHDPKPIAEVAGLDKSKLGWIARVRSWFEKDRKREKPRKRSRPSRHKKTTKPKKSKSGPNNAQATIDHIKARPGEEIHRQKQRRISSPSVSSFPPVPSRSSTMGRRRQRNEPRQQKEPKPWPIRNREHAKWFHQQSGVGPQFDPQHPPAKKSRPDYGLSFAPHPLPGPHMYAPKQLLSHFDPSTQRWLAVGVQEDWSKGGGWHQEKSNVSFAGRLPGGLSSIPVPLYGEFEGFEAKPEGRLLPRRTWQKLVTAKEPIEVRYQIHLRLLPDFEDGPPDQSTPKALMALTSPDKELPAEVHEFVDELRETELDQITRCLTVRDFIRENYTYDPSYLEDPHIARWLRSVSKGRRNAHLAALHAGRDARSLGRGVCYELNTLACELLRRSGIPAGIAVGWTLDRGSVAEPDHLWAMALLHSRDGLRWYPIDASSTRDGRPLHFGDRPAGPWHVKPPRGVSLPEVPLFTGEKLQISRNGERIPTSELVKVLRFLSNITGNTIESDEWLRRRCRELLSNTENAQELLAFLVRDDEEP
jgi:hypothetical protein